MTITWQQAAFLAFGAVTLAAALLVVFSRNLFHAALWLAAAFTGVACIYVTLHAEFVAMSQMIVYVGAVAVLMLFAVFLTEDVVGKRSRQLRSAWVYALPVSVALCAILLRWFGRYPWKPPAREHASDTAGVIGIAFLQKYLFAFELTSIILLAALIGAILLAREEKRE